MSECGYLVPGGRLGARGALDSSFASVPDLVQAIPYLVGFPPSNSLVASFWDDAGVLVLTGRLDWRDVASGAAELGRGLGERAAWVGAVGSLCVAASVEGSVRQQLAHLATVATGFRGFGITSSPGVVVHDGRWTSSRCGPDCPELGHDLASERVPPLVARLVASGRGPVPSRDAVGAEVEPTDDRRADMLSRAVAELRESADDLEEWRDRLIVEALDALLIDTGLTLEASAAIAAACADLRVRDTLLWCLNHEADVSWDRVWEATSYVLRLSRAGLVAPVGAVAAIAAWQGGDGLRAGLAIARAERADPRHPLTELVGQALHRGLPPHDWSRVMRAITREECRRGPRESVWLNQSAEADDTLAVGDRPQDPSD